MSASDNEPYFDWPEPDGPAREVWYSLVSHPDEPVAFWYRYTLVSTPDRSEARVWAALSDAATGEHTFTTQAFDIGETTVAEEPFSLSLAGNELTDGGATGAIEGEGFEAPDDDRTAPAAEWSLAYEPDTLTFTPLADEARMLEIAEQFDTGVHWSANQSVAMTGDVQVGGRTVRFEDAPGHQGHTAGASAPDDWAWVHCNDFDADVALEVLSMETLTPACLRLPDETHLVNGDVEVFDAIDHTRNDPGRWELRGDTDDLHFAVEVAVDPTDWQCASYLTPDGSLRYNAHCSLAEVTLEVDGDRHESERGRAEWVQTDPPVDGSYPPFDS
jgi:hypothetical protein